MAAALILGTLAFAEDAMPIDFSINIEDLDMAAKSGDDGKIPGDALLVLNAQIGAVTVRADDASSFVAEVELIGGAWHGEADVSLYRAYALFEGLEFKDYFSRRASTPINSGDSVLILGRYLGLGVDYDESTTIAVVEAYEIRPLP